MVTDNLVTNDFIIETYASQSLFIYLFVEYIERKKQYTGFLKCYNEKSAKIVCYQIANCEVTKLLVTKLLVTKMLVTKCLLILKNGWGSKLSTYFERS